MANKFGRQYRLTVEMETGDAIVIEPPFTLNFNVQRSSMASLNSCQLQIYNLKPETRQKIFQDRLDFRRYRKVILQAGYDDLATLFVGNLFQSFSYRQGVDIITSINARDGEFDTVNAKTFRSVAEGTTFRDLLKGLIGDFTNITEGTVGDVEGELIRPAALDGNTYALLDTYSGNQVFIDLEKVNILKPNEVLVGEVPLISPQTGLLKTPQREDAFLTIATLFEPRIIMSQIVELQSTVAPVYDGQYKAVGVTHQGTISGAVGGECQSTFNLLLESQLFGGFTQV